MFFHQGLSNQELFLGPWNTSFLNSTLFLSHARGASLNEKAVEKGGLEEAQNQQMSLRLQSSRSLYRRERQAREWRGVTCI